MSRIFSFCAIFVLTFSALAQDVSKNNDVPKITVSKIKWSKQTKFSHFPSGDFGMDSEAPPLNAPSTIDRPAKQQTAPPQFFVYQADFKNENDRAVIGLAWDYVFFDRENTKELNRYKFRYLHVLKSSKTTTLSGNSSLPPTTSILASAAEKGGARPYSEKVEINCVVFNDKTTWKKPGVPETVCEDLRIELWKRQERMKNLGY